eukprot:CAMPEP_0170603844 /NCGR_PEP_ID=MMETSP0224-20130122/19120_1 /TAXON_ID=285029 /ORGANISM="Togula jolla, Strain CCCM 725" /LENGTH=145 /DNA_ID=CAMNT_0010928735 /DNA_START=18 /DNA_END=455 /DNA_ORIENTATION=+
MRAVPPWWIQRGVKPAGPGKDMGSWTAITFSPEQQEHFGINESGEIQDQAKFDAAIAAIAAPQATPSCAAVPAASMPPASGQAVGGACLKPWWILHGVAPAGPAVDKGTWTASSFSAEQQDQFGVDSEGTVQDKAKFEAAISALK